MADLLSEEVANVGHDPEEAAAPAAPTSSGTLPLIYHAAAQARVAGYSWDEINDRFTAVRSAAKDAGYTDGDVDKAFGLAPSTAHDPPLPPELTGLNARPDVADNIRAFANKYLTPFSEREGGPAPTPQTAGEFARMLGWDAVDLGRIFGRPVVNGLAAIVEGLDGKPRAMADQVRLGVEAEGFLAFAAGKPPTAGALTPAEAAIRPRLQNILPTVPETVDAAAAVAQRHPDGITPETLTAAAQAVGAHFSATGEPPLAAASNPDRLAALHQQTTEQAALHEEEATPAATETLPPNEPLDAAGVAEESATAVREPGFIPAIGISNTPVPGGTLGLGGARLMRPQMAIDPETIGQPNPQLGAGMVQSFQRIFNIQSLAREGAGVIRHWLADTQANRIRSTENLRRFGRAVADMPSVDRRVWWRAYEGAEVVPLTATDEVGRAQEMMQRAGVPAHVGVRIMPTIPAPPGLIYHGYYNARVPEIVLRSGLPDEVVAHEIFHAVYDPTHNLLTTQQRAIMDTRAQEWLQRRRPTGETNRQYLQRLGYPPSQMVEEGGARLIGENLRVTNARDALARYNGTPLGYLATALREELDSRYLRMSQLDIAHGYIDGYLPRLYQDPAAALRVFGRRPLEGTKTFTRQRVYQYLEDAEMAGLRLATDNPLEATLIRLHDMDRYISAHEIMNELEARGIGTWIDMGATPRPRIPPGLSRVNDKITQKGAKFFYAPDPIAIMLNRHLSPGLSGMPIYDAVRGTTSMVTTLKLMLSAFHPLYLGWSSMAEAFGLGLKQIARGGVSNIVKGAGQVLKFPIAPLEDVIQGNKIIDYAKTGVGAPRIANMYNAMIASGARFGRSEAYQSSAAGSFWNSIKGSMAPETGLQTFPQEVGAMLRNAPPVMLGNVQVAPGYMRAMAQMIPRVLDTLSDPIMGKLVPMMKAGALSRMLQEEMAAHPGMGVDDIREFGGRMSDIIDNRIGEVVQDNLFWPTIAHNINNVVFLAPQWFLGKLRLLTGAAEDAIQGGFIKGPGGTRELSDNISYLIGGIAATVFTGAVYGYLKGTWKPDWTVRDYIAPPTGGTDKQGGPERIMLPSMWRDVYGWEQNPKEELMNKVNTLWGSLGELATNTQFSGAAITDPSQNWKESGGDYAAFVAKELSPIAWSQEPSELSNVDMLTRILGAREAPFGIREPELNGVYNQRTTERKVRQMYRQEP